ncbi:unnamed protein product [Linum tenue]|nr:unnamed protein product [Linum tenue]
MRVMLKQQSSREVNWWWWLKIAVYAFSVLLGQSGANLLGRLYFLKGGTSKWISSVVQVVGFPILLPFYLLATTAKHDDDDDGKPRPSPYTLGAIYASLGLIIGINCFFYSVGLQYLPVSTYTLLCASQLAFNSFFSYFINGQKFTPFIVNSLVLLTISSVLLVFNNEESASSSSAPPIPRAKYVIGFFSTLGASALFGLVLSATQFVFVKVIRRQTFRHVMDMVIYENLVASVVTVVGLFASGEWEGLGREMDGYGPGTVSYLMTLIWIAVFWQMYSIGALGLIFEVSALFCNSISVVGLPIVPIAAVFFFHDKMSGVKGISMALAVWGFVSYVYQYYVDDRNSKGVGKSVDDETTSVRSSECKKDISSTL